MSTRVKIFATGELQALETIINEWMTEQEVEVIDIKFCEGLFQDEYEYSAMIIYKTHEN